jgi:hypothetical protein
MLSKNPQAGQGGDFAGRKKGHTWYTGGLLPRFSKELARQRVTRTVVL